MPDGLVSSSVLTFNSIIAVFLLHAIIGKLKLFNQKLLALTYRISQLHR